MSIHFISGKPGGGKSLLALRHLVEQLKTTQRLVVTNLPVNLTELQIYFDSQGLNVNVLARVVVLEEEQVPSFYRFRGQNVLQPSDSVQYDQIEVVWRVAYQAPHKYEPDLSPSAPGQYVIPIKVTGMPDYGAVADSGVCYILDELHIFFNARQWKNTGEGALFYLSQHRKLGDVVFCITQSIGNVDKQFRSVAQDFTYCRNERIEKFGKFRKGSGFVAKVYLSPASGANDVPCEAFSYPLDLELCECYNTAGGVGVNPQGAADKGAKAKGFPLWVIWAALPAGLLGIYFLVNVALPAALGDEPPQSNPSAEVETPERPALASSLVAPGPGERNSDPARRTVEADAVLLGYMRKRTPRGDVSVIRMSDGQVFMSDDAEVSYVGIKGVRINGVMHKWWRRPPGGDTPAPAAAPVLLAASPALPPSASAVLDPPQPVATLRERPGQSTYRLP